MELAVITVLAALLAISRLQLRVCRNALHRLEDELPQHVEKTLIAGFEHGLKYAATGTKPRRATLLESYRSAEPTPPREEVPCI